MKTCFIPKRISGFVSKTIACNQFLVCDRKENNLLNFNYIEIIFKEGSPRVIH